MRPMKPSILACMVTMAVAACAQQPVYTQPYVTAAPAAFAAPVPVALSVSYARDGKPDPKRAEELKAALTDALNTGSGFRPAAPGQAGDKLEIIVDDRAGTPKKTGFAGFTAAVGH